jgi:16S rRNA (guanine(527)-N(7))-methyltransferase RsmG
LNEHFEQLGCFARSLGVPFGPELRERMRLFLRLLVTWNRTIRLTGDRDLETLVLKHCGDSLAFASRVHEGSSIVDVGSGGGFPGLVAACACPQARFTLIDSKARACSFLDVVASELGLSNVFVVNGRVRAVADLEIVRPEFNLAVSRGVRFEAIASDVIRLLRPDGVLASMAAPAQDVPDTLLRRLGIDAKSEFSYTLPTGEPRRIVEYALR